ncbi:glycosyl hydrolase [Catenovulum sediminis]|uniref:glycosyl hydrolase n=1 Tax=Catenovulum sediminis TaxID=1740262 RepID=UPI00117FF074|nr:glycosyl hydrolase [Catenovulum sediminis]
MNITQRAAVAAAITLALVGCGNEEPVVTYTPEVSSDGPTELEDNRLLEPVMLNYLNSIKGQKTVVGVHNREPNSDPDMWTEEVAKTTGVWPGLWSGDFLFSEDDVANRWSMIYEAEKRWKQGMLVNIMMHVCPPTTAETCGWNTAGMHYELTEQEWLDLLTNGTELNNTWKARLDNMAFYLDYLNKKGVRVMFRPFHEMNQTIFWWSSKTSGKQEYTAELYRLTHDYLVDDKDLTNLTFVWNVQDFATLADDLNSYDPGDEYWDILSLDMYGTDGKGFTQEKYDALVAKAGNKPIALGEVQTLPSPELLLEQPLWAFVMSWAELTFEHNSKANIRELYNADNVVKLDDMPGWTDGNKTVYEVPSSGAQTVEPLVIFNEELTNWKLPSTNANITEAVVIEDENYGNVVEHTYVGIETVSEFRSDTAVDLSGYVGGTLEFDLKVVNEPTAIDGNWFMKIDCGWPCGTGDVPLTSSVEGVAPTVGQWQHYTFNIDDLIALENNGNPLQIDSVSSPLVIFPEWGANQKDTVFRIDNIVVNPAPEAPIADTIIFADDITDWKLPEKSVAAITETVVDAEDAQYGKVIQHEYVGIEVVSEFSSLSPLDFSAYTGGTLSFDLLVVTEPEGIDGNWFMKMDCGWPCGTGDVRLDASVEGVMPSVGMWQHYTFKIDDLLALENNGSPLQLDSVNSPLVVFPQWGANQKGAVFQIDNIILSKD